MTRQDRYPIDRVIGVLEHLTVKLPAAKQQLRLRIARADGYPRSTNGQKVTHTTTSTTELAVDERALCRDILAGLDSRLEHLERHARDLIALCDRHIAEPITIPVTRCTGGHDEPGADTWGRPDCPELPEVHRKLCPRCRKARDRWRRTHGPTHSQEPR